MSNMSSGGANEPDSALKKWAGYAGSIPVNVSASGRWQFWSSFGSRPFVYERFEVSAFHNLKENSWFFSGTGHTSNGAGNGNFTLEFRAGDDRIYWTFEHGAIEITNCRSAYAQIRVMSTLDDGEFYLVVRASRLAFSNTQWNIEENSYFSVQKV